MVYLSIVQRRPPCAYIMASQEERKLDLLKHMIHQCQDMEKNYYTISKCLYHTMEEGLEKLVLEYKEDDSHAPAPDLRENLLLKQIMLQHHKLQMKSYYFKLELNTHAALMLDLAAVIHPDHGLKF